MRHSVTGALILIPGLLDLDTKFHISKYTLLASSLPSRILHRLSESVT